MVGISFKNTVRYLLSGSLMFRRAAAAGTGSGRCGPDLAGPDRTGTRSNRFVTRDGHIDKYTGLHRMGNREPNRRDLSGQRRHFQGIVDAIVLYC
jgi:hypothetical protein